MKKILILMMLLLFCLLLPADIAFAERIEADEFYLEKDPTADEWRLYFNNGEPIIDYFWSTQELNFG